MSAPHTTPRPLEVATPCGPDLDIDQG